MQSHDLAHVIERREGVKTANWQEDVNDRKTTSKWKRKRTDYIRKAEAGKITEDAKLLGVFGILSSGVSMTADEILLCYRTGLHRKHYTT